MSEQMYAGAWNSDKLSAYRPKPRWKAAVRNTVAGAGVLVALGIGFAQVAQGSAPPTTTVIVKPGQSLWGIAATRYPDADIRQKVGDIERLNHLSSSIVFPGEQLVVPSL